MKRALYILALLVLLIPLASCCEWFHQDVEKRMVLLYIAATESSLSPYAEGNVTDMLREYVPKKNAKDQELLVFFQMRDTDSPTKRSDATLTRYYSTNAGKVVAETISNFGNEFNAADPESFARVLALAESTCKPAYRSLLISSHGTGWLPVGYFDGGGEASMSILPKTKSFRTDDPVGRMQMRESIGYDSTTRDEMDIREFARAMSAYHWESALLDCCYMGTVEVACQLRNCCDYVIGSPTEILITGFPYLVILDQLFNHPGEEGLKNICKAYYDLYQGQSGSLQSGTIALVKCSEMDALANICADIVNSSRSEMESVKRSKVQRYFYNAGKDYFFDLAHYFELFATEEQYTRFSAQLNLAVPYKASTEKFLGLTMEHYCGLSCYIPSGSYPKLNAYYTQLDWNQKVKIIE